MRRPFPEAELMDMLLKRLDFDRNLSKFIWKDGQSKGEIAGVLMKMGYRRIALYYSSYQYFSVAEHRLVWYFFHKTTPPIIDHSNGIKTDNRIENLRESCPHTNSQNTIRHRQGNIPNASRDKTKFRARMQLGTRHKPNYRDIQIGNFDTPHAAHKAAKEMADKLGIPFRYVL